ncbi:isoleucine--tRNA ligase [Candidatus Bathyarchaeota archaeon ex4484_231]|nr:MAG: isoleucine--tRNA ligase [Candidatus Bathyarchaeota archaeon ex4484_231]
MFREVTPSVDFPELERRILKFWTETQAFKKRVELNKGKPRWSFMDGPITANNPMMVHHAWGRTYKDLFQRFKAMQGHELRYQNGFDCQGLWIEVEVEKELGFKTKRDIEAYGIAEFVKKCKQRALRYAAKQVEQSIRLGYWMDWDNPETLRRLADSLENPDQTVTIQGAKGTVKDTAERIVGRLGAREIGGSYFTFSDENNYTIWTALKKCYENGWIYKGRDVMPWCPRCSTALSQHEIVTEGYRELTHPGITVKFPLRGKPKESLLIWTTTPWTLTSNVAAAVHPNYTYVKVLYNGEYLYLGKFALERTLPKGRYKVVEELEGSQMEGWTYNGPYDELQAEKELGAVDAHQVILWKEVTEEEGTGIVHIAPGCGKEDLELGKNYGLPAVAPLDEFGVFIKGFGKFTGVHVYDSAPLVIEDLKKKGILFKYEDYTHRYPVCWRCGSELVFRLVDEWFISMGEKLDKPLEEITPEEKRENLRYQIIDAAKQVRWIPEFGLQQELDWLQNMEDWMISKKRYWGLALPIWVCESCGNFEVIGSKEELKKRAVEGWDIFNGHTPHRPWVDAVKIKCPKCGGIASRIKDVGNPWLDAGIVSYSTLDYRHDPEYWKKWFPAELICESLPGQFRNWFYAMLAMSTIMENKTPFKVCFGYGLVLGEDGREMHKSWGNAIEFDEAAENMGADVMRWMYCTKRPETNLLFGYNKAEEIKRRFLIPLWNIYSFFVTYANLDKWKPENSVNRTALSLLDRWILSKLNSSIKDVTQYLNDFDPYNAAKTIEKFVEELSTWYVRRSRRRFWKSEKDDDKNAAYTTLYACLTNLVKILAPFIPFTTEEMYQNLVRSVDPNAHISVHHNDWPIADEEAIDKKLMADMDLVIRVCSLGRSARSRAGIKLRQPLSSVKVVAEKPVLETVRKFKDIIVDELNVKELSVTTQKDEVLEYVVKPLPRVLGKKHGRLFPKIREAIENADTKELVQSLNKGLAVTLNVNGQTVELLPEEVEVSTKPKQGYSLAEENDVLVAVDVTITENLKKEGLARDIVRRIQNQRKEAGFNIADYIETYYEASPRLTEVFKDFGDYIASETLSKSLRNKQPPKEAHTASYKIEGEHLKIGLVRINH